MPFCSATAASVARARYSVAKQSFYLSNVMGKQTFCICENKDADQLRGFAVTARLISAFVFAT